VYNVYFYFALEQFLFMYFSPSLLNVRWILLDYTVWFSLSDDQNSAIILCTVSIVWILCTVSILWILCTVSIVFNLFRSKHCRYPNQK
jgi:hypothetical protein